MIKLVLFFVAHLCMLNQIWAQVGIEWNDVKPADSLLSIKEMILRASEIGRRDSSVADKIFRMALQKAIIAHDPYNAGKVFYEMGEMYFQHRNYNKSLGAFISAKDYFVKSNSEAELGYVNFKIGRTQYYRGNYKLASGHLFFALQVAKQLKLKNLESDVVEYMGILYHVMPNPGYQSSSLLQKSLAIKKQLNDQNGELRILEKLSAVYYDQKKFDSALYCSESSIRLAEKLHLTYDANLSCLNQIPALLRSNMQVDAKRNLYYIKTRVLDSADLNIRLRYYIQAGNYSISIKDLTAGQKKYDTALQIAQKSGFPEMYSLVYINMAEAYYYINDFKKAYDYQLQYVNQKRSLYSNENYTTFKELEYVFKINTTEDEVKYLSAQNEIKEVRLKNEKSLRLILLLSAAGFLLCAAIIFYLYRTQKIKSQIIEKQGEDLQTLMKEIHHRVKNNLQVISSLLDLQSLTIGDKQAAEAIKESRNRVQTMALIHQNLYQKGNMKGVEMEKYITNLANSLFSSYHVTKNKIQLKTSIEPVSLDVDLVILIGLVLNELISNALKYAFCANETGTLFIKLEQHEHELLLEIKDTGVGFPPGFNIFRTESFGYKLVRTFADKLKAKLDVFNDNGACVQLYITKFKFSS